MNQQIKLLAGQAGMVKILEEHASEYGNGTFENTPYPELEKFAELLVLECITECDQHFAGAVGTHASAHNSAIKKCVDSIKSRFRI